MAQKISQFLILEIVTYQMWRHFQWNEPKISENVWSKEILVW